MEQIELSYRALYPKGLSFVKDGKRVFNCRDCGREEEVPLISGGAGVCRKCQHEHWLELMALGL